MTDFHGGVAAETVRVGNENRTQLEDLRREVGKF
jgi:hypothetical protein